MAGREEGRDGLRRSRHHHHHHHHSREGEGRQEVGGAPHTCEQGVVPEPPLGGVMPPVAAPVVDSAEAELRANLARLLRDAQARQPVFLPRLMAAVVLTPLALFTDVDIGLLFRLGLCPLPPILRGTPRPRPRHVCGRWALASRHVSTWRSRHARATARRSTASPSPGVSLGCAPPVYAPRPSSTYAIAMARVVMFASGCTLASTAMGVKEKVQQTIPTITSPRGRGDRGALGGGVITAGAAVVKPVVSGACALSVDLECAPWSIRRVRLGLAPHAPPLGAVRHAHGRPGEGVGGGG